MPGRSPARHLKQKLAKMSIIKHIAAISFALLAFTGCIREDRSSCKCDIFLNFIYNGDGSTDIFPEKIKSVNMYVYSTDAKSLHSEYRITEDDLAEFQGTHLMLPPGSYRIVLWGNVEEQSRVKTEWGSAYIAEPGHFSKEGIYYGTDPLYFNTIDIYVPETLQDVEKTCLFEGAHIKMKIKLIGFSDGIDAETGEPVKVELAHTGCPEMTDFAKVPSEERCDVTPEMTVAPDDPDAYLLEYNIFRFDENDGLNKIVIRYEDGREIYTTDVAAFLDRYGIRIEGRHEISIPVKITYSPVGVTVVNWGKEDVDPGFEQ